MRTCLLLAVAVGTAFAARGSSEQDEAAAARAFAALQAGKLDAAAADAQVRALVESLDRAGLPQTATVALSVLGAQEGEAAVSASRELQRRAAQGGLALGLAMRLPPSRLEAGLAVRVARAHLEQALVLAPLEEGSAFAGMAGGNGAALTQASAGAPVRAALPEEPVQPRVTAVQRLARAELERARQIAAQVPDGAASAGEAHEVSALAALAAGDTAAAEEQFEAVVRVAARGAAAAERREDALLQLARLAYSRGDDARAQTMYARVSRGAPQWLDALFESSWSHFRRGEDEKALGNLLTLHAPFFQGRYFPESHVLKALVLYENCRYADARRALDEFEARYRPVHDGLAEGLQLMPTAQSAVEALASGGQALLAQLPAPARPDVARLLSTPELTLSLRQVASMARELDSIDARGPAFRGSALVSAVIPQARSARLDLVQRTGDRVRGALASERGELRELLGQSLRLGFEIAGREKDLAAAPASSAAVSQRRPPTQVDDDEEMWPFQGEYWRDELGSYRFHLGDRCARPATPLPVQQAQVPAKAPPAAAAVEPPPAAR
ncbi:MAG: hypothetical protein ACJ79H_13445 [Myxococcales bacterium]